MNGDACWSPEAVASILRSFGPLRRDKRGSITVFVVTAMPAVVAAAVVVALFACVAALFALGVFAAVLAANPVVTHEVHRLSAGAIAAAITAPVGLLRLRHV